MCRPSEPIKMKNYWLLGQYFIARSKVHKAHSGVGSTKKIIYCINKYLITIITALTFFKLQNKSPVLFTKLKVS